MKLQIMSCVLFLNLFSQMINALDVNSQQHNSVEEEEDRFVSRNQMMLLYPDLFSEQQIKSHLSQLYLQTKPDIPKHEMCLELLTRREQRIENRKQLISAIHKHRRLQQNDFSDVVKYLWLQYKQYVAREDLPKQISETKFKIVTQYFLEIVKEMNFVDAPAMDIAAKLMRRGDLSSTYKDKFSLCANYVRFIFRFLIDKNYVEKRGSSSTITYRFLPKLKSLLGC